MNICLTCRFWYEVASSCQLLWSLIIIGDPIPSNPSGLSLQLTRAGTAPLDVVITVKPKYADPRGAETTQCLDLLKGKSAQWTNLTVAVGFLFRRGEIQRLLPENLPELREAAMWFGANGDGSFQPMAAPKLQRYSSLGSPMFPFTALRHVRAMVSTGTWGLRQVIEPLSQHPVESLELWGSGMYEVDSGLEPAEVITLPELPSLNSLTIRGWTMPRVVHSLNTLNAPNLHILVILQEGSNNQRIPELHRSIQLPTLARLRITGLRLAQVRQFVERTNIPADVTLQLPVSVAWKAEGTCGMALSRVYSDKRWVEGRCKLEWMD